MAAKTWSGVPVEKLQDWRRAYSNFSSEYFVHAPCPICGGMGLRRYYYFVGKRLRIELDGNLYQGKGGFWAWCTLCRSYLHSEALVPEDWVHTFTDFDHYHLTPVPDVIDDKINEIVGRSNCN